MGYLFGAVKTKQSNLDVLVIEPACHEIITLPNMWIDVNAYVYSTTLTTQSFYGRTFIFLKALKVVA